MGPEVGSFVSKVRITQKIDDCDGYLPGLELRQNVIEYIRTTNARVTKKTAVTLGEQFPVDVNCKTLARAITTCATEYQALYMAFFKRRYFKSLPLQEHVLRP